MRFRLDGLGHSRAIQIAVAAAVLVFAWPIRSEPGRVGIDINWQFGLYQAAENGLRFGRDLVFTYGPLGFLSRPIPFFGPASAVAFIVTAAIYLAFVSLLLHVALRLFPAWVAALVTLAFARGLGWLEPFETLQILAFGLGVEVLRRDQITSHRRVAIVAGALAGFAILGKLNVGVFVGTMGLVVVLAVSRPRLQGVLILAASTLVTVVALWLAAGQQLADLVPYVRTSQEVIAGYSDAMGNTPANTLRIYAAFILLAAVVVASAYRTAVDWPRIRRLALAALVIVLLFAIWKFVAVRTHIAPSLVTLCFATLILLPTNMRRIVKVGALTFVVVVFMFIVRVPITSYFDVKTSSVDFVREARDALVPARWDAATDRTREYLRSAFDMPPAILAALSGHTVSIDPLAAAIASAYPTFTWKPVPIFQTYAAYTTELDEMNADMLRSAERPEMIVRHLQALNVRDGRSIPYAIDNRTYWFDSPEATLERLCRYREVVVEGPYQVLTDSGRQCGEATPVASVTAKIGETVAVPAAPSPDDFMLVRVHGVGDGLLAPLRSTLWKTPPWQVRLDGLEFRLVPGTADDGLVLAVPAVRQGTAPFAFGPPIGTIAISGSNLLGSDNLVYEFFTVPLPKA